jgi:tetratricopeptide (TPR) repeat protein
MLRYSKFLHAQGRKAEASAILASVWEEHSQSTSSAAMTETSASLLTQIAHVMQSVGLSSVALSVFKYCAQYCRDTNRTQTSTYEEIQQSIHVTSQEILQSSSSSMTVLSETTLEEMVVESSSSLSTAGQTTLTATKRLVSFYTSHHRWRDATRLLEKVLHGVWASLFSVNVQDVALVEEHVETCVDLARRLAECYQMRRRLTQEEDMRVRVYRALRSTREVDDKLRERATNELVAFYTRTSQTERVITLRQEMLGDYTEHYGDHYPTVIKMLWKLAELTRPRPIFIEYYQKIIRVLNQNTQTTTPEALQPIVLVATELWSQGLYSEALPYYRTLFATFLKEPTISPKFEDQTWARECFVRYTDCMRSVRTPFSVLHRTTAEYQAQCKKLYGTTASITIQATLALARLCQESTSYTQQAMTLYEELLQMESKEIDRQDLSANLEMLRNEQRATDIISSSDSTKVSSSQINHAVTVLQKRITSVRKEYGWAHQESLSNLTELVRLNIKQEKTETAVHELKKATVNILETETTATRLIEAASTIASNYLAIKQAQSATQLLEQVYSQIVMKEVTDSATSEFDLTSRGRESLVFLAQLEYSLRRTSATSLTEILATLTTEYVYFEKFRAIVKSSNSFHDVSVAAARLRHSLVSSGRCAAAAYVFERTSRWFMETEAKRLNLTTALSAAQVQLLLQNVLDHLGTHRSEDMVRTVGIIGSVQVVQLRNKGRFNEACDLAMACFRYIAANNEAYRTTPTIAKLVLQIGLAVGGGRETATATAEPTEGPDAETRKKLVETSGTILHDVIKVLDAMKINLAKLDLVHLNRLIGLVGEQQDWPTLASLLACLWASRDTQRNWPPSVTFALARRHILARWFAGDSMAALRMAEHVVYNCRRVHSLRHPATLEMSVLLSQIYTGTAQRYQHQQGENNPGAKDMANRYYRKAAAIHENILRVFTDPVYASMDDSTFMDDSNNGNNDSGVFNGGSPSVDGELSPRLQKTFGDLPAHHGRPVHGDDDDDDDDDGHHVRQHLLLLKLAVQRLGCWPKDYAEYERLNADVFREYHADLKGVGGVEKWDLSAFGDGKAEADLDLLRPEDCKDWELLDASCVENWGGGQEEEEEL